MLELSIVVPAFNEASRLGDAAERLDEAIRRGGLDRSTTEMIVVDDGSRDDTGAKAKEVFDPLGFEQVTIVPVEKNMGKGAAVRAGMARARAPLALFTDADMSIDPAHMPDMVRALGAAHVAIGRRPADRAGVTRNSKVRSFVGNSFNHLANSFMHLSLTDTQCGFKAFRTPVARLLFHCTVIDRFAFDVELLSTAHRFGLIVTEVPVEWRHMPGSRIRPFRDPAVMVADVFLSRTGLRRPPPLPGIRLPSGDGVAAAIAGACGTEVTVVSAGKPKSDAIALFPLQDDDGVARLTGNVMRALGDMATNVTLPTVESIEAVELAGMAPLSVEIGKGRQHEC